MKFWTRVFAFLICSAIASFANAQGLTKCTDANGKVTYSDQPCPTSATSGSVQTPSSGPGSPRPEVAVTHNIKTLLACEQGKKEACYERELVEKRCQQQRKEGTGVPLSDCKAYEADRSTFRQMSSACTKENRESACAFLACANGDQGGCQRAKLADQKSQQTHSKAMETARTQGLPSGSGWFMHQDWRDYGNGRLYAGITCNRTTSVFLERRPPMLERIYTGVTGREYFLTVEEAARKACAKT